MPSPTPHTTRKPRRAKRAHAQRPARPIDASGAASERAEVAGVRLSHPGRVYFPDIGVTKSELARYYETMRERALPLLARRPLSLLRCPNGCDEKCFYQKHVGDELSERVGRVVVARGEAPYTFVKDLASLIELIQIAVIEFHVWGARVDAIDKPDLLVFDLDPDPAVKWRRVAESALRLRRFLEQLELVPFLRTTGGKGLHLVVPIMRRASWDEVKSFTRNVALRLVQAEPEQYTARFSKARRHGKILIDHLRNQRDATAVASYSVRARPGAPVAMPLAWDELDPGAREAPAWNLRDAPARLASPDPWQDFEASRRVLGRKTLDRVRID